MCSLTAYEHLLAPTPDDLSRFELRNQFRSLAALLDAVLSDGTREPEQNHDWLQYTRRLCANHVVRLSREPWNPRFLDGCHSYIRRVKSALRYVFVHHHGTCGLDAFLRDVLSLAYGTTDRAYNASHFASVRDYGHVLLVVTPALRCGCFVNASFNRVDPATGLPPSLAQLADVLQRWPGFHPPPGHPLPPIGTPSPQFSPLDQEFVRDLLLVCRVLRLNFAAVMHQLVAFAGLGYPSRDSPYDALGALDFESLAHHTVDSLRLLRRFEGAQEEWLGGHGLPIGNAVARAVVRTQVKWFERLWADEDGFLRFTLTPLARSLQLRVREGLPPDWPRIGPLFYWTQELRWVDQTQDERWVTWLRNSELQTSPCMAEQERMNENSTHENWEDGNEGDNERGDEGDNEGSDEGGDDSGDDGDDDSDDDSGDDSDDDDDDDDDDEGDDHNLGRRCPVQAVYGPRRARTHIRRFGSAEHFVCKHISKRLKAAIRNELSNTRRRSMLKRGIQLSSSDLLARTEYQHPVHRHLWDTIRGVFEYASTVPQPLDFSLEFEIERLLDLLIAGWEAPALLPRHFMSRTNTLENADNVPKLQWLVVFYAKTGNLGAEQAAELARKLDVHLTATTTRLASSSPEDRSEMLITGLRSFDLPKWIAFLRRVAWEGNGARQAVFDAEYRAVAVPATRDQHAALLAALPVAFHPSVNFLHPDTLTHVNANPQYHHLLDALSALRHKDEHLRARLDDVATRQQCYGAALLAMVRAEASRQESPEFGPVTAAESVPVLPPLADSDAETDPEGDSVSM